MDDLTHKFVAVLNKKVPVGNLMNALGHMAAGLGGSAGKNKTNHGGRIRLLGNLFLWA